MKKIIKWKNKTKKQKIKSIILNTLFLISLAGTIIVFVFYNQIYGEDSVFYDTVSDNSFVNWCYQHIPSLIGSIQVIIISIFLNIALKFVMHLTLAHTKKGITITQILGSFLKWGLAIDSILVILTLWGVDTTAIVASAGVLTLVVGLGAQSLIADIIAGLFIVFEEEFEVGDIIVLDGWRGTVVEIGIRTTRIQDAGGNIKIVNNSEIKSVINQTKQNSIAKCYLNINYEENLDNVQKICDEELQDASSKIKGLLSNIQYRGVSEYSSNGVTLFFMAKCKEPDIFQIQRDMNKVLKEMLEKHGVYLAYQNIVVHNKNKKD